MSVKCMLIALVAATALGRHAVLSEANPYALTLYASDDCTGEPLVEVPYSNWEKSCVHCWESCDKKDASGAPLYGSHVHSIFIPEGFTVEAYQHCAGPGDYTAATFQFNRTSAGCVPVNDKSQEWPGSGDWDQVTLLKMLAAPSPPPPELPAWAGKAGMVRVYPTEDCSGDQFITAGTDSREDLCSNCWDACGKRWPDGSDAANSIRSVYIAPNTRVSTQADCDGIYENPSAKVSWERCRSGCFKTTTNHFSLAAVADCASEPLVRPVRSDYMGSRHWGVDAGNPTSYWGLSFYTRVFSMLKEYKYPLQQFQVGQAGVWWVPLANFTKCACPTDSGFGAPPTNCCQYHNCDTLYQVLEGGAGYSAWNLPTTQVRWNTGTSSGCYTAFGNWGQPDVVTTPVDCTKLGSAVYLSNRLLMPPNGATFTSPTNGMLGVAQVNTPLGQTSARDTANAWTLVLDAANFAGPVLYTLPEYWKSNKFDPELPDFSNSGLRGQGNGLELMGWEVLTQKQDEDSDVMYVKLPRLAFPLDGAGVRKTTLMAGFRAWGESHLFRPLAAALQGQPWAENNVLLFNQGSNTECNGIQDDAPTMPFKDKDVTFPGRLRVNSDDPTCPGYIQWDSDSQAAPANCSSDGWCYTPEYARAALNPAGDRVVEWQWVDASSLPAWAAPLKEKKFAEKLPSMAGPGGPFSFPGAYDGATKPATCWKQPGPADPNMYCIRTKAGTWLGYRWYRFVDQPSLQRLKLPKAQRDYMQAQIVKLHELLNKTAPLNKWLKAPKGMPQLVRIDPAIILKPPKGKEAGYVPVAVYESPSKAHPLCSTPQG